VERAWKGSAVEAGLGQERFGWCAKRPAPAGEEWPTPTVCTSCEVFSFKLGIGPPNIRALPTRLGDLLLQDPVNPEPHRGERQASGRQTTKAQLHQAARHPPFKGSLQVHRKSLGQECHSLGGFTGSGSKHARCGAGSRFPPRRSVAARGRARLRCRPLPGCRRPPTSAAAC